MIDLTPLEVRKKKGDFRRGLRGYDPEQVDNFLDIVADRLEQVVREHMSMSERVGRLEQQVADFRDRERALTEALVTAQEMREEMRTQATREADLSRRDAEQEAERIRQDALQEREREEDTLRRLRTRQAQLLQSYRAFLERELSELAIVANTLELNNALDDPLPMSPRRGAAGTGGTAVAGTAPERRRGSTPDAPPRVTGSGTQAEPPPAGTARPGRSAGATAPSTHARPEPNRPTAGGPQARPGSAGPGAVAGAVTGAAAAAWDPDANAYPWSEGGVDAVPPGGADAAADVDLERPDRWNWDEEVPEGPGGQQQAAAEAGEIILSESDIAADDAPASLEARPEEVLELDEEVPAGPGEAASLLELEEIADAADDERFAGPRSPEAGPEHGEDAPAFEDDAGLTQPLADADAFTTDAPAGFESGTFGGWPGEFDRDDADTPPAGFSRDVLLDSDLDFGLEPLPPLRAPESPVAADAPADGGDAADAGGPPPPHDPGDLSTLTLTPAPGRDNGDDFLLDTDLLPPPEAAPDAAEDRTHVREDRPVAGSGDAAAGATGADGSGEEPPAPLPPDAQEDDRNDMMSPMFEDRG